MAVEDFDAAFARLLPRAQTLASRVVGDPVAGRDIAAEALARAYARWSALGRADYRDGWVLRVTANLATDWLRRKKPRPPTPVAADVPDAVVLRLALTDALGHLPRRQRQVIVLRYFSDLSEADVAAALKLSVGTVKTHHHRAIAALRDRLGERYEEGLHLANEP